MGDYSEESLFCARCGEYRLHRKEGWNTVVGVLLAIFTCFIGFIVWLIVEACTSRPWRCATCGLAWEAGAARRAYFEKHPEEAPAAARQEERLATPGPERTPSSTRPAPLKSKWFFIGYAILAVIALVGLNIARKIDQPSAPNAPPPTPSSVEWYDRAPATGTGEITMRSYLANNKHPCGKVERMTPGRPGCWRVVCLGRLIYDVRFNDRGYLEDVVMVEGWGKRSGLKSICASAFSTPPASPPSAPAPPGITPR